MPALPEGPPDTTALSTEDVDIARQSSRVIADFARGADTAYSLRLRNARAGQEAETPIPASALRLITDALTQMADGHRVSVMPVDDVLGTQEAANLLGVSRSYLVALLEQGRIPYSKVGARRRVRLGDLRAYMRACVEAASPEVGQMADEAQRLGLYE